jgi:hypothetical protein
MESVVRILMAMLLTVSAASAVQFSIEETFGRIRTITATDACRMEQAAESASCTIAHQVARVARASMKSMAAASPVRAQYRRYEIAQTMEDLWKAYGH